MSPNFPIPSSMVETGVGPNQIPRRDPATGDIPGAPVIFSRILTDELAELIKRQVPSGFIDPKPFINSVHPFKVTLDTATEIIVDGYRMPLGKPNSKLDIQLGGSPNSGTRDDLIFLEFWFDFAASQSKALKWRIRIVEDVNFISHPNGLTDPKVTAFDSIGLDTYIPYQKINQNFLNRSKDAGLYIAAKPDQNQNILSETGLDNNSYILTYALPVAQVKRINLGAYHPVTNPNGGPAKITGFSNRPDGLFNDFINVDYQLIDLRNTVSFTLNPEHLLQQGIVDYLKNRLTPHGFAKETAFALNDCNQQTYFGDISFISSFVTPTNLILQSHFRNQNITTPRLAVGWSTYQTGGVTGISEFGDPGQVIERTAIAPLDVYGVEQEITGFCTKDYYLQFGYILAWANTGAELVVEAVRNDDTVIFSKTIILTTVTPGAIQHIAEYFDSDSLDTSLTLRAYLKSSGARLTLTYFDLRAAKNKYEVMEVTDGTVYSVTLHDSLADLGAVFRPAQTSLISTANGTNVESIITAVGNTLQVTLVASTSVRDLQIFSEVFYPKGFGFNTLFKQPNKAWDKDGFAGTIKTSEASNVLTNSQLGLAMLANESIMVFNPETSLKGTTVVITFAGNGTGTYTIPATKYGRPVLLPLNITLNGSSQILSGLHKNADGTFTFTLANNIAVNTSTTFMVEVALGAPILTWNSEINGVQGIYSTKLISKKADGTSSIITIPATGVVKGVLDTNVCLPVFVNGESVLITQGITALADNKPFITINLPFVPNNGDVVEVAILVKEAVLADSELYVAYKTIPSADNKDVASNATVYRFLTGVTMLAHTKGTGAVDLNSDFGPEPFVKDANLESQIIALVNKQPIRSTVLDIPIRANSFMGEPIYTGRRVNISSITGTFTGVVEGDPLNVSVNHRVVLAALVEVGGRVCLWLAESYRTDSRNLIDSSATVRILDLNRRPLTIA